MHKIERLLQTLAPKGVEFRKLGDIGEYIRGVTYKKNQEINNLECGIKVLRANNITLSNHLNFEDIKVINKNVKIRKEQYLKKNDILICAGSGSSEHIGKVAFVNTDFDYVFGGFMGVIRIREINSRFVYHIFTSNIFKQYLEKSLNTTTINNLNANILQNFLIPIPPLEIQQEIVKILDAFTELNTELNTELKARKKQYQYYQNMLLDFKDIKQNHKDAKERLAQKTYPKRLKSLLQTLAPKGVEFRKLGEVLEYDQPNKYCVTSKEFDKSYPTPVLTAGKTFILGYTNEKDNIYQASKSSPVIIFDDFTTATQWVDFPFKVKSSAMKILLPKNPTINIRFIFFYMQTIPYNISGEHTRQWISRYSQLEVPIPPLEIQQEIVKILDQFSILTTDLLAGIPAEIEARKKQYEYYREKLLSFKPLTPHKEVKK
ncbi:restriction endonuclease subunit S [Helicobacter pylori]|uniref:restriction endonuclease subunit S n=1 Tax=Helicobacter pylori TaxID=210 RepID=UPI001FD01E05|nr:restriction endonuclease subunit S [Helicobacter pylori]UOR45735.1 restriction endonuclease subunit S [Helicobacter pylori]